MTLSERFEGILDYFRENVPSAQSELVFTSPFELIVAVVLSAQCTDRRVNATTPELFRRYPDPLALSLADEDELFGVIHSISYPRSKARHLIGLSKGLVENFGGEVPSDVKSLMTLPGVGRKTANVVSSIVYGEPVIAVDTHVFRVSHRLGLSGGRTPDKVEADLERHVPPELRPVAHHWLILHGRYICTARNPRCGECPISAFCKFYEKAVQTSRQCSPSHTK